MQMYRRQLVIFGIIFLTTTLASSLEAIDFLKYFTFSEKGVLNIWKEKLYKGKVNYTVVRNPAGDFIKADANQAASGLYYEIKYDPRKKPYMSWKWKVDSFPAKDPHDLSKAKDDFAARVYVIFPASIFIMSRCLEYAWDNVLEEGSITPSPLSGRIKMFTIRKGKKEGWIQEERNIFEDYLKAYGEEPEDFDDEVGAIAFMTDSDDSKSRSVAYVDELKIGYAKPEHKK